MKETKIEVLVLSPFYIPGYKGGGPIKTLKNLFDQVGDEISFRLLTSDRDLGDTVPYASVDSGAWHSVGNVPVFYAQAGWAGQVQIVRELRSGNYDVVYLNSFFSQRFAFFPLVLSKVFGKQAVLSPRGEFSEGALSLKRVKKRLFINVFMLLGLHRGVVFQASSDYEAQDIRRALGSGVDIQVAGDIGSQEYATQLQPRGTGSLRVAFVSRISPKKNLLGALNMLKKVEQPLIYDVYGPIEDHNYWVECEKAIAALPSHIQAQHKGALAPHQVVKTLQQYDAFFFPTKGENYGHVIAEALCAGLPIVISDTTPWRKLQDSGIGWDLSLGDPGAFSEALNGLAAMSAEEHLCMRRRVLTWAKQKFSQRDAIEANVAMFRYAYKKRSKDPF